MGARAGRTGRAALRVVALVALLHAASASAGSTDDESAAAEVNLDGPPVELHFTVVERGPKHPWEYRIENASSEPVSVVVDPRLLWFEATVPGKKKTVTCKLPRDMFPKGPDPDAVEQLMPGRDVVRTFDPRFFCFSTTDEQETLVPGAQLTPFFGWPHETKTKWRRGKKVEEKLPDAAPFVATPTDDESNSRPVKNLEAAALALDSGYAIWAPQEDDEKIERIHPEIELAKGSDAKTERTVSATIRIRNRTKESKRIFFRRELVTFEVLGPDGLVACNAQPDARDPGPSSFVRLRSGGSMRVATRVVELCPRGTFARPGFYLLNARFDASVSGTELGIDAWTGSVRTERPVGVRVRKGTLPFLVKPKPEQEADEGKKSGVKAPGKNSGVKAPGKK